jgi:hypothetical protein
VATELPETPESQAIASPPGYRRLGQCLGCAAPTSLCLSGAPGEGSSRWLQWLPTRWRSADCVRQSRTCSCFERFETSSRRCPGTEFAGHLMPSLAGRGTTSWHGFCPGQIGLLSLLRSEANHQWRCATCLDLLRGARTVQPQAAGGAHKIWGRWLGAGLALPNAISGLKVPGSLPLAIGPPLPAPTQLGDRHDDARRRSRPRSSRCVLCGYWTGLRLACWEWPDAQITAVAVTPSDTRCALDATTRPACLRAAASVIAPSVVHAQRHRLTNSHPSLP